MVNEVYMDNVLMQKTEDGLDYTRCFHCGKMFVETYEDKQLHNFCSPECEKADSEYWSKVIEDFEE